MPRRRGASVPSLHGRGEAGMMAKMHPVTGRTKRFETYYSTPGDFTLGPGDAVDPAVVLREPGWAPYCLDAAARSVCFAHVPEGTDLHAAPFCYLTQYQRADRFVAVPAEDALALAAALPEP